MVDHDLDVFFFRVFQFLEILNNLNLNGIGDEEVIKLYSSVLDEIGKVQIAEREVTALHDKFRKGVHRQVGMTALAMVPMPAWSGARLSVRRPLRTSWLRKSTRWPAIDRVSSSGGSTVEQLSTLPETTIALMREGSIGM